MPEIDLKLSVQQVDLVLACMARQPYEAVFGTIESIKAQVSDQLQPKPATDPT